MNIPKVTKLSDQELFESIDSTNTTGFRTEDLVDIIKTDFEELWSEPMSYDELIALMDSWDSEYDKNNR